MFLLGKESKAFVTSASLCGLFHAQSTKPQRGAGYPSAFKVTFFFLCQLLEANTCHKVGMRPVSAFG